MTGVGGGICPSGSGVVTTGQRLMALISVGCSHRRTSVRSVVRRADVISTSNSSASRRDGAGHFGITETWGPATALPELNSATTSVVVSWAGAKALLLLVVTGKEDLDNRGEKEEDPVFISKSVISHAVMLYSRSDNSDCESSRVQPTSGSEGHSVGDLVSEALLRIGRTISNRRVYIAAAALRAVASKHCDSNKGSRKEDIKNDAEKGKECFSTKTAGEEDSENGIQDGCSRDALNGLALFRDGDISIRKNRQEVAVDTEYDASTAKFECIEDGLEQFQKGPAESHCGIQMEKMWMA